jgi:hypothetical protein
MLPSAANALSCNCVDCNCFKVTCMRGPLSASTYCMRCFPFRLSCGFDANGHLHQHHSRFGAGEVSQTACTAHDNFQEHMNSIVQEQAGGIGLQ